MCSYSATAAAFNRKSSYKMGGNALQHLSPIKIESDDVLLNLKR
jgi:hypothetical protein